MHEQQQQNSPYQQPNLLDILAARDAAVAQVEENANAEWKEAAYQTGIRIAREQDSLLSEDIWQALSDQGVHTHEPRAMGAIMKRLRRDQIIEATADFVISPSPLGHGRPSRVWKSLVVAGTDRTSETHDSARASSDQSDTRPRPDNPGCPYCGGVHYREDCEFA